MKAIEKIVDDHATGRKPARKVYFRNLTSCRPRSSALKTGRTGYTEGQALVAVAPGICGIDQDERISRCWGKTVMGKSKRCPKLAVQTVLVLFDGRRSNSRQAADRFLCASPSGMNLSFTKRRFQHMISAPPRCDCNSKLGRRLAGFWFGAGSGRYRSWVACRVGKKHVCPAAWPRWMHRICFDPR